MANKQNKSAIGEQTAVVAPEQTDNTAMDVVQDVQPEGKRKKRGKKDAPKVNIVVKNARPDTAEVAMAKQEMYGIVRLNDKIKVTKWVLLALVGALLLFIVGSYLIYYYTDIADFNMTTITHTHSYHEQGDYIEGDCQHKGYVQYRCKYPNCDSDRREYDDFFGNHKYDLANIKTETGDNGEIYNVFTCKVCGEVDKILQPITPPVDPNAPTE